MLPEPSIGEQVETHLVEVDKVFLLDTKVQPMRYGNMEEEMIQSQDSIKPDLRTTGGGREGQLDDVLPAPSVVQANKAVSAPATCSSSKYSQPATQRSQGKDKLFPAGTSQGAGDEHPGTQPSQTRGCVYSKGGVCGQQGPGAKLCWKPVPVEERVPGPGGRLVTREYFYRCEVGPRGSGLRQSMISFGRVTVDARRGDNRGPVMKNFADNTIEG